MTPRFIIKIRAFNGFVEYREGDKIATVPVQPVFGRGLIGVYMDSPVKWNPPHTAEVIAEQKRSEILKSIVEALRFRNYKVEVVEKTMETIFDSPTLYYQPTSRFDVSFGQMSEVLVAKDVRLGTGIITRSIDETEIDGKYIRAGGIRV